VETFLQIHSRFVSKSIYERGLPLSAATFSLHCLARSLRSTVTHKQNTCYLNTKCTFEDLLPSYCYAIKANSRTSFRNFRNLPLRAKEGTWANCKLITARQHNCEAGTCAVLRRVHTESGYGLRSDLWPTALFTQAPWAVSAWISSVLTGFRLT